MTRSSFIPATLLVSLVLPACRASAAPIHSAAPAFPEPANVAILVYEGVELLDFAGPGEVFAAARGKQGRAFRVYTVAATPERVQSQGFVDVTPQYSFADAPQPAVVVVPGGNVPEDAAHVEWLRQVAEKAEIVLSVCNGAHLLADAGLLDGLEATTHHGSLESLAASHPKTRVYANRRFVDNGKVITCAGVSAGIDGALHLVERLHGDEAARHTARYMEYEWRPEEIAALHAQPGVLVGEGPAFVLAEYAKHSGTEAALSRWRAAEPRPTEAELNQAGYFLLQQHKGPEARALLELVVAAFPESPNAYDSLSEACERLGDAPAAIRHAETALERLKTAHGTARPTEASAKALENSAGSRLVRLGRGDASRLRFACPPCGGSCDALRYLAGGPCPSCHMPMTERAAGE